MPLQPVMVISAGLILILILKGCSSSSASSFPFVQTTFNPDPSRGFFSQPLTVKGARRNGWVPWGSCLGNPRFRGRRYIHPDLDNEAILLYDSRGLLAGMQSAVPKSFADDTIHNFTASPYYQEDVLPDGTEVWLLTVYFVDPNQICRRLRKNYRFFRRDGVVTSLFVQSGQTFDNKVNLPLTEDGMKAKPGWNAQACFVLMGTHYLHYDYDKTSSCLDLIPMSVLYNDGKATGFVFSHLAPAPGPRFEVVGNSNGALISTYPAQFVPDCQAALAADDVLGIRAMHVYFGSHLSNCEGATYPSVLNANVAS